MAEWPRLIHGIETQLLDFIGSVYDLIHGPASSSSWRSRAPRFPLPSELIMPLAGWMLIKEKELGFEWVVFAGLCGAVGNTLGSLVAYYAGAWGGRPLVERYGRYILISHHDLDLADRFFTRWGAWAVFFARLMPIVRTFVSVPAGISRMNVGQFTLFTFAGSFPWSLGLAAGRLRPRRELGGPSHLDAPRRHPDRDRPGHPPGLVRHTSRQSSMGGATNRPDLRPEARQLWRGVWSVTRMAIRDGPWPQADDASRHHVPATPRI